MPVFLINHRGFFKLFLPMTGFDRGQTVVQGESCQSTYELNRA